VSGRTRNHTLLFHLRVSQPGGQGPRIYMPQEQGGPVISPGTGFPLPRLLRLAGLRWRYSNPPPTWRAKFPAFICPRNRVTQLYPRALGSLYIVSYDSPLTTCRAMVEVSKPPPTRRARSSYLYSPGRGWSSPKSKPKSRYDQRSVSQYDLVSSPRGSRGVEVEVTLQLTVIQSLCQGNEPILGLVTRYYFLSEGCSLKFALLSLWGALSDERSGLSFVFPSVVIYHYLHQTFTLHVFYSSTIYVQYI
jgi:hypothetical protein